MVLSQNPKCRISWHGCIDLGRDFRSAMMPLVGRLEVGVLAVTVTFDSCDIGYISRLLNANPGIPLLMAT